MTNSKKLLLSCAELLACAFLDLFPGAQLVDSACFDYSFRSRFLLPQPVDPSMIPIIEERMRGIAKDPAFQPKILEMLPSNAATMLRHYGQELIADRAEESSSNVVPILQMGSYYNVCPPLLVENLKELLAFKILNLSKGEGEVEIAGVVAESLPKLKSLHKAIAAGLRHDYLKIGEEGRIFDRKANHSLNDWSLGENGITIRELLAIWWRFEHRSQGFHLLSSPSLVSTSFLRSAGIHNVIGELPVGQGDYSPIPSFYPLHADAYRRQVPGSLRLCEIGPVWRQLSDIELDGALSSRSFTSDQATIFCAQSDLIHECISSLLFIDKTLRMLGFGYQWCFTPNSEKFAGMKQQWTECAMTMRKSLEETGLSYTIDEDTKEETGPALTAQVIDCYGRRWSGPVVSANFKLVKAFGLKGPLGKPPVMLTRTVFGSLERWIAILTEHFSGRYPLWLSPEQVRVLPYRSENSGYAMEIATALVNGGIRARSDSGREPIAQRVRLAEKERVPYVVVVGEQEQNEKVITVRSSHRGATTAKWYMGSFLEHLQREVITRNLPGGNTK